MAKQQLRLKPGERKLLLKLGAAIDSKVKHLITIVRYDAYLKWKRYAKRQVPVKKMGRHKRSEEIRELILKLARETHWG